MPGRPPDPRSDEQLVAAMNAGEREAFDAAYHRYRDWVLRLALRTTGHQEDALDVLQETFAYFFGKFPGFELRARLTTFLYQPVVNLAISARRKRQRLKLDPSVGADLSTNDRVQRDPSLSDLYHVLACLPDAQRDVLLLRFVDDFGHAEIAQALGIPEGTVKSRIHNAIAALRVDPRTRRYFGQEDIE